VVSDPSRTDDAAPFAPGDALRLAVLLFCLLVLATRLATLLHEALGHAATAAVLGADVTGVSVSLFGGGCTDYAFPDPAPGAPARALAALGGIGINLLTGVGALAIGRRLDRHPALSLFASLFGAASLTGAVAYLTLGLYYDVGDPVAWMTTADGGVLWMPCLPAVPAAGFAAMRRVGSRLEGIHPAGTWGGRVGRAVATLGVAAAAYAGCFALAGEPLVAADAGAMAHRRDADVLRRHRLEAALARARADHPDLGEAELRRLVEATLPPLRPDEIPARFPLAPVVAALLALGGLAALRDVKAPGAPVPPPAPRTVALAAGLALAVLAALAFGPLAA
jgi:hypothetical protein